MKNESPDTQGWNMKLESGDKEKDGEDEEEEEEEVSTSNLT